MNHACLAEKVSIFHSYCVLNKDLPPDGFLFVTFWKTIEILISTVLKREFAEFASKSISKEKKMKQSGKKVWDNPKIENTPHWEKLREQLNKPARRA